MRRPRAVLLILLVVLATLVGVDGSIAVNLAGLVTSREQPVHLRFGVAQYAV